MDSTTPKQTEEETRPQPENEELSEEQSEDALDEITPEVESSEEESAKEVPPQEEPEEDHFAGVHAKLDGIDDRQKATEKALGQCAQTLQGFEGKINQLPESLRALRIKVADLTVSVSEARLKSLLVHLLDYYDMVERMAGSTEGEESQHANNYEVLRVQLRQLLESNGLSEIPTDGLFDPKQHRAIQRKPCDDEALDNRILEVLRLGFAVGETVLRYPDVIVAKYQPEEPEPVAEEVPGEDNPTEASPETEEPSADSADSPERPE